MSSSPESPTTTRMFARVLGPFLVIICITAVVRAPDTRTLLSEFGASALWPWMAGSFVLLAGLIIIALHPYWRGVAAIIVSVLGWLVALRGLLLLTFPATFVSMANSVIGASALWNTVYICFALIGLYLAYVGWTPAPSRPKPQSASLTPDLPRAT